jgi:hypothetical protein
MENYTQTRTQKITKIIDTSIFAFIMVSICYAGVIKRFVKSKKH